jgi:hypothetical protein
LAYFFVSPSGRCAFVFNDFFLLSSFVPLCLCV